MEVTEGQVLAGKYRIERVLGRGGMGVVVAANHLQLGERVALKFLLPEALLNPEAVARFDREARAAVKIKSEHVARVSDVGNLESGAPYMVMEYLEGVDLSVWLTQRGALPIEQAVEFVLQACEAIAEAHTLGIVHRDLKPANLFVIERPDGGLAVKVLDFGISKLTGLGGSGVGITSTTATMGSPLYMSPEQMESAKDVDTRGDIWALGVVLYELVSARLPFPGETMAELVLKVVTAPPVPLRVVCAHAPPGLEEVVLKCLRKNRGARYQTVAELAFALFEFAPRRSKASVERIGRVLQRAGMSAVSTQLPPSSDAANSESASPSPQTLASWGQTNPPPAARRRVVLIAVALVAVPVLAVGVVALLRSVGHGSALASSAVPSVPQSAAEVLLSRPAIVVETAAAPIAQASSTPAQTLAAMSASTAPAALPRATSSSSTGPKRTASDVSRPATATSAEVPRALPQPKTVVAKPATPTSTTNPLKMTIQ